MGETSNLVLFCVIWLLTCEPRACAFLFHGCFLQVVFLACVCILQGITVYYNLRFSPQKCSNSSSTAGLLLLCVVGEEGRK